MPVLSKSTSVLLALVAIAQIGFANQFTDRLLHFG